MIRTSKDYFQLFFETFKLSAFTFGGGYVIVPLMQQQFVKKLGWIEEEEMLNLVAIAQSAPGPIAINTSILIGYKVAGLPGAILSTLGTVLPPLTIISIVALFYDHIKDNPTVKAMLEGMQSGVAAIILFVVFQMAYKIIQKKSRLSVLIMVGAFVAAYLLQINIIWIIIVCALIGIGQNSLHLTRKQKEEDV